MSRPPDPAVAPGAASGARAPSARGAADPHAAARGAARAAADRSPDAGPRHAAWWAAASYAVALLLLAYPALVGRFLVTPQSDQYIAGYAFREFAASWLRQTGSFPLWNPYLFGGMPYVAAMHGDIFYPTFLLRLALPTDVAMTWGMVIHVYLAGLFAYLFLRAIGVRFAGALVGGLAYMLGGNVAGLVSPGHDGKIFVSALLPLALLLILRGVRQGRAWAWGGLALTITLAVLTPHPQLLQYLLLLTGAWALYLALAGDARDGSPALPRAVAVRRLALALGAVLVGLLGGAIQFWPVVEYTPWSPRSGGRGWEHAISYSMPPEELINTYVPQFSGILDAYTGRNGIHFHSEYIGAAVLVLAGLAFGTRLVRRSLVWFWVGALATSVLWALGGYTPFYRLVYAIVPYTKYLRAPSTMLYIVSFCVAVLAALGTDRLLAREARPRYAIGWLVGAGLVAVLATVGALSNLAAGFVADPRQVPLVDQNAGALTVGAWRSFLVVAIAAGVALAARRGALRPHAAGAVLAVLVALDLWSVERNYWQFADRAARLYATDPVIEYLKVRADSGRVVPLIQQPLTGAIRDPYFGSGDGRADGLMVHRIRSAVGYHGNELENYRRLSGWESEAYFQHLGNPNFWRLANLRYLYTNAPQAPIEGMRLVAGPTGDVTGNTVYLFEFPGEQPPAWVTPLAVKAPDENVLATVLDPRFDVRRVALFDTASAVATQPVPQQLPEPLDMSARLTRYEPGRIDVAFDRPAPAGSALVVSENYYPGWRARADGRPAQIGRADGSLIGVALPAGTRTVELTFTSPRYETGKLVTLVSLAVALLATVVGWGVQRTVERRARG